MKRGENGRGEREKKEGRTRVRGRNIEGVMERRKVTQRTDDGMRCGARRGRVEGRGGRRGEANVASAELDLCDASEDLPQILRRNLGVAWRRNSVCVQKAVNVTIPQPHSKIKPREQSLVRCLLRYCKKDK